MSNDCSCLTNVLKVIDVLQKNADGPCSIESGCTRRFLGTLANTVCYNTRPVTFYKCDGTILNLIYGYDNGTPLTTSVFRVQEVKDCCVKVLMLIPNPDTDDTLRPYISTNVFATINLKCVCALQCLPDVIIDCV